MSLKRKLTLDDEDTSVVATAAGAAPSSTTSVTARTVSASATAKRPRLHDHAQPSSSSSTSSSSHRHRERLQRPTDARPRSSSAPCPITLRTPSDKLIYPPWMPDVTRESLRSLDLDVLQMNVQFRHDFMLDGPHKFTRVIAKPKRDDMTRYWLAVLIELETGCTCVAFDDQNRVLPCVCPPNPAAKLPSRVLPMLAELRSLIRHVTAPTRLALLDEHHILDAIRLGVYDYPSLFRFIGQTLKEHCAPMRDARIDSMVIFACGGPQQPASSSVVKSHILQAIRMCFDVVELMAMDIANHQLLTYRPRLLSTTASMELAAFSSKSRHQESSSLQISCAQASMQRSFDAIKQLQAQSSSSISREQSLRATLIRNVVDLVFNPTVLGGPRTSGLRIPADFPETLYLDHSRLCRFGMEAADLTVLYMVMLLARSPPFSVADTASALELKSQLECISPPRLGLCFGHALRAARHLKSTSNQNPAVLASRMEEERREWRAGVSDVLLQIARRASSTPGDGSPLAALLQKRLKDALCEAVDLAWRSPSPQVHATPAPMYAQQPCAQAVMLAANRQQSYSTLTSPQAPVSRLPVPKPTSSQQVTDTGLEPLASEINVMASRIAELIGHHWNVYHPIYTAPGFLP
ncbi:T-complex protein 11-domain-containing protein [Auriculariales sp. MPI-PUGE-AT-0066]|nr:T-complex protein 11-domain-containing protein [Auriculariales sp. MPI-PUGE-AT-0066]KAH7096776.1 T-complex protein 11-domain-containing protein [Auriculariales sp. MPI-PUGE-AT-0066]